MKKSTDKPSGESLPLINKEKIIKEYIKFRVNPVNDRFDDAKFCSEHSISLANLEKLKTMDVVREIAAIPLTDTQMLSNVDQLLRIVYSKAIKGTLPVKSFEGMLNAFTNLLKQQQLVQGKPTDIIKFEDIEKMSPRDLHRSILNDLQAGRN